MTTTKPVALVAGASTGIGKATATALASAGFDVVATARNTARMAPVLGVGFIDLEVTDDASVARAVAHVIEHHGRIDVLVNNAGIGSAGAAEESTLAHDQAVFDVNVFGIMRMTKAVLPHMRAQGSGRIINVSSILGFVPQPFMAAYAASKHAVEGYSESVDHEVRDLGIRVLLVEPAVTKSNFDAARSHGDPVAALPAYAKQRRQTDDALAGAAKTGDEPELVATAIVKAATDHKPKLRYTPGKQAGRIITLRRYAPRRAFDNQIRKFNGL
jgi:short-subunit dehydrogenase